jgi:hypothetical protein
VTPHIFLETHRARQLKVGMYFSKTVGCYIVHIPTNAIFIKLGKV